MDTTTSATLAANAATVNAAWLSTLSSTLGASFQLWQASADGDERVTAAIEHARQHGYGKRPLANDSVQVWIALPGRRGSSPIAYGTLSHRDPELLDLLIQAARTLITQERTLSDQSADVASCLETLSYGLEEQNWLRSLTSHLTLCSARRTLRDVARELLPSLCRLIRADAVTILLMTAAKKHQPDALAVSDRDFQSMTDGSLHLSDAVWQAWLQDHSGYTTNQPIVQNGPHVDPLFQGQKVRSVCAVPIVRDEVLFGWVVALKEQFPVDEPAESCPLRISELEFGTIEAGLVEAGASMLATHGHNVELLEDRENLAIGIIRAMGNAVDARDPYTRGHSERVGRYGRLLARAIGLPDQECDRVYLSGLLHDVGKIGIPDTVLGKPGKLTEEEFAIIKRHPEIGYRIIQTMPQLADLLPGILYHHESVDGTGYPRGLAGDAIPLMGRILAVADGYDAMTSDRPYRQGMPIARAREILTKCAGTQWDAALVNAFLAIPLDELILDTVGSDQGWNTDEYSLRGGTAALFDHHNSATDIGRTTVLRT